MWQRSRVRRTAFCRVLPRPYGAERTRRHSDLPVVSGSRLDGAASVAETRDPRERLVDLDDAQADRIALRAIVHEIPRAVGDLARVLGRRRFPQAVDEQQLELLHLLLGRARRQSRQRFPVTSRHMPVATSRRLRRVTGSMSAAS